MRSHLGWRRKQNIPYKGVKTSPEQTHSKTLKGSSEGKPKESNQYLLAVGLDYYNYEPRNFFGRKKGLQRNEWLIIDDKNSKTNRKQNEWRIS